MSDIIRYDVNEECAYSGMVEAGSFVFITFCACDGTGSIESQINRVFDHLSMRLESIGLTLESVVKLDALFRNIWDIPVMEAVIKERFNGKYPARKSFQTNIAHDGLLFQLDAIAYRG